MTRVYRVPLFGAAHKSPFKMKSNFPCSLCGSRDWPRPDTECPLCYGDAPVVDEEAAVEPWNNFFDESEGKAGRPKTPRP